MEGGKGRRERGEMEEEGGRRKDGKEGRREGGKEGRREEGREGGEK